MTRAVNTRIHTRPCSHICMSHLGMLDLRLHGRHRMMYRDTRALRPGQEQDLHVTGERLSACIHGLPIAKCFASASRARVGRPGGGPGGSACEAAAGPLHIEAQVAIQEASGGVPTPRRCRAHRVCGQTGGRAGRRSGRSWA